MGREIIRVFSCNLRSFFALAFLIPAGLMPATLAAQNLLINGDFEQNDLTTYPSYSASGDFSNLPTGQPLPGWTFYNVDLYGPTHLPQSGSQFLDLVGYGPLTATFSIQQTFATVIGNTYRLDFFFGNNEQFADSGGLASFTASLVGLGLLWSGDFTHGGDTSMSRDWTEHEVDFVADSATTTLTFLDTSQLPATFDPDSTVAGATLDNVSVVALPETGGRPLIITIFCLCLLAILVSKRSPALRE